MQSFDTPTGLQKAVGSIVEVLNSFLPPQRQLSKPKPKPANVLLVAATNRADSLDPALLRPGRFDRRLTFALPGKTGRRALIDYYLDRKAHAPELDDPERRDALAAVSQGYSPAKLEHLLDEGLVNAVRRGSKSMTWNDLERARLTVVPSRAEAAPRAPFVVLVVLLLAGGVAGLLAFNTSMQQASFKATALEQQAAALAAIDALPVVKEPARVIRIVG